MKHITRILLAALLAFALLGGSWSARGQGTLPLEQHRYMSSLRMPYVDIALVSVKNKRNALDHPAAPPPFFVENPGPRRTTPGNRRFRPGNFVAPLGFV